MTNFINNDFELGTCTIPDCENDDWLIDTVEVSQYDADMYDLRCLLNNTPEMRIRAGTFKRLVRKHSPRAVVMSNTPMEIQTNAQAYWEASGDVIINGLGLGMILEAILSKEDVTRVRVIEISQSLIDLIGPYFLEDDRLEIICADALEYKPAKGEKFDFAWHDIWDEISADNLPEMATLGRRYSKRICADQAMWSRDLARKY